VFVEPAWGVRGFVVRSLTDTDGPGTIIMKPPNSAMIRGRMLFEAFIVIALQIMMMFVIALAVFEVGVLLYRGAATLFLGNIDTIHELQSALQRAFAGVLLVLLGMELLETLKNFFTAHHVRLQVILIVAIIAVTRHIMVLDLDHTEAGVLLGVGVLIVALTLGYFLIGRATTHTPAPPASAEE
jgi:uncharacterized membrane protein (DUF373 family)